MTEPDDCAAYLKRIRQEGVVHFETSHRHRDGHVFPIETSTSMITFEGHELILGIDHDITEKKRVEEALRETQLRYRAAVEQSNDGIGIADLERPIHHGQSCTLQNDRIHRGRNAQDAGERFGSEDNYHSSYSIR